MARRLALFMIFPLLLAACSRHRIATEAEVPAWSMASGPSSTDARGALPPTDMSEDYQPIPDNAAAVLGCADAPDSPICSVAFPSVEEDSAFRAEAVRLATHSDVRCQRLGEAISVNEPSVRMYRKALVKWAGPLRLYGVGHTYEVGDEWLVRVARRLDDLNERTLGEKLRTLRHEMSHTIGATETSGPGWSAEDYATNCG